MTNKNDPHYGALLIEQARLHLGTVMAGQDSEPFFIAMLQIVEADVHHGYLTLRNKRVKLRGIKDLLFSVYYGLGIRDMPTFLANIVKSSMKERSKNKYGHRFIQWLKDQGPEFTFPQEYFEFRRVMRMVFMNKKMPRKTKILCYKWAKFMYNTDPTMLQNIGWDRKYKTVQDCYYKEGYEEKRKILTPIKTYQNPTEHQLDQLVDSLFKRLGIGRTKLLGLKLIDRCRNEDPAWDGYSEHDDDHASVGSEWIE